MKAQLPCCQGLPEHTYDAECLLHREECFDISTEDGRKALARKLLDHWRESGEALPPGLTYIRLEPGEDVLSEEDVRRLLGDEAGP